MHLPLVCLHVVCCRGIITEEDSPINACTTHLGEHIRFEVVINTQTENSCRDQDETPARHSNSVLLLHAGS